MNGRIHRADTQATRLAWPRIGKIKIGKKAISRNGKEYPTSVDYFIPSGKYAELFVKAYGQEPRTIQIIFPDDDPVKVCNEYYEYRDDKGQLIAKGDGVTFNVWNGRRYQVFTTTEYPDIMQRITAKYPNAQSRATGDGWRVRLTMNFVIPMVRGVAGVWTFETNGSASTIPNIRDAFDAMLTAKGYVQGIIFDLNVKFAQSQKPDDRSRYPVVSLVPNESEENVEKIKNALNTKNILPNNYTFED